MARALPQPLAENVSFATNGMECVEALQQGKGDLLFLDLNMPVMDGYEVMQAIRNEDLPTMVIVVSGDIQPEAHARVMSLGALDFIKKPVRKEGILEVLDKFGILSGADSNTDSKTDTNSVIEISTDSWDCYKEIANVAMGQAADLLARLLGVFIKMPIPKVKLIKASDLQKTFQLIDKNEQVSCVCQGFIGKGIAGEALLVFNQSSFTDIAELLLYEGDINETVELELLMDIGSVMIGAFLNSITRQLELPFSQNSPTVLGKKVKTEELLCQEKPSWEHALAIELRCSIENRNIKCNLLLLFTEDSLDSLNNMVTTLAG